MNVPERLKQLMSDRSMTVYALAKASGLHWQTIKNLFVKTSNPSVATMTSICNGLGITLSQFFAEENETAITLTAEQNLLLQKWNSISKADQQIIISMLDVMLRNQK